MVAETVLSAGYATEDGTGLHYVGTDLREAVSILPGRRAWSVEPTVDGGYAEQALRTRLI
jgi:hypothetical protein